MKGVVIMWLKRTFEEWQDKGKFEGGEAHDLFQVLKYVVNPFNFIALLIAYIPQSFAIYTVFKALDNHWLMHQPTSIQTLVYAILITMGASLFVPQLSAIKYLVVHAIYGVLYWLVHPFKSIINILDFVLLAIPYYTIKYAVQIIGAVFDTLLTKKMKSSNV